MHPPPKYHGALQKSKMIAVRFSGRITPKPEARIIPVKTVTRAPCWVNAGMLGCYTDYMYYSLNSLKGDYIREYIGNYYRDY